MLFFEREKEQFCYLGFFFVYNPFGGSSMKTLGKVLLFIGSLIFFAAAVLEIVNLVLTCVRSPSTFFGTDPLSAGILAFIIVVLWLLLDLFGGFSGMVYAVFGTHRTMVSVLSVVIIILFVLGVIGAVVSEIQSKTASWDDWSTLVYGGVAGAVYVIGYCLDKKKA